MERDDVVVLNDIIQARRIIVANFLHLLDLLATFLVAAVEVVVSIKCLVKFVM